MYLSYSILRKPSDTVLIMSIQSTHQDGPFIVQPKATHTHTFLLLHGLGSTGERFGEELLRTGVTASGRSLQDIFPGAKFVFPTSRKRRSSAFNRSILTQWFDIASLQDPSYKRDRQLRGLSQSASDVLAILARELKLVAPSHIILGGLSQGCAMSLAILLSVSQPLGGFVGMSGWLPHQRDLEAAIERADDDDDDDPFARNGDDNQTPNSLAIDAHVFARDLLSLDQQHAPASERGTAIATPIFLGHGSEDEKIAADLGKAASEVLQKVGFKVDWKLYEGQGHWYKIPDEINDLVSFVNSLSGWQPG